MKESLLDFSMNCLKGFAPLVSCDLSLNSSVYWVVFFERWAPSLSFEDIVTFIIYSVMLFSSTSMPSVWEGISYFVFEISSENPLASFSWIITSVPYEFECTYNSCWTLVLGVAGFCLGFDRDLLSLLSLNNRVAAVEIAGFDGNFEFTTCVKTSLLKSEMVT